MPEFKSKIPAHLLSGLPETERWLYDQVSIQGQQNEWIIRRSIKSDIRQDETAAEVAASRERIEALEQLRRIMTAKWSVVIFIFSAFAGPIALAAFGAWMYAFFEKWMNAKGG